jgi:eps5I
MFLSVIIPVYKVEKYLEQCLVSVLRQTSTVDFEVIAVDDGSPDNCGCILDQYANLYSNLKVIHKQNQGLSIARNTGLDIARGEYVWFVDSDDWLVPGAFAEVVNALLAKPDILEVGFNFVWADRTVPNRQYCWNDMISGCDAFLNDGLPAPAQFTIVKRKLLIDNNLRFYPSILHEDTEYKPKLAIMAQTAICLDKPIYNYRQRESGNIMSTYGFKNAHDIIIGCHSIINFVLTRPYDRMEHEVIGNSIGANLNHLLNRLASYNGADYKRIIRLIEDNRNLFRWMRKSRKRKYRIEAFLFEINFGLTFRLLQFLQRHR